MHVAVTLLGLPGTQTSGWTLSLPHCHGHLLEPTRACGRGWSSCAWPGDPAPPELMAHWLRTLMPGGVRTPAGVPVFCVPHPGSTVPARSLTNTWLCCPPAPEDPAVNPVPSEPCLLASLCLRPRSSALLGKTR